MFDGCEIYAIHRQSAGPLWIGPSKKDTPCNPNLFYLAAPSCFVSHIALLARWYLSWNQDARLQLTRSNANFAPGILLGALLVGCHMALNQGVAQAMVSSYVPSKGVAGLGRISGTCWSFTDLLLGENRAR